MAGQLDLVQRAGFHRLARSLADQNSERLQRLIAEWPEGYRRFLLQAHARVCSVEMDPNQAVQLRADGLNVRAAS